jgi:hypothetical protein
MARGALGEALPGTALADWLERVKADPEAIDTTRASIRALLCDPAVAGRVRAGLRARLADEGGGLAPFWLRSFLVETDGALTLHLRLGGAAERIARLRRWVYACACEPLVAVGARHGA